MKKLLFLPILIFCISTTFAQSDSTKNHFGLAFDLSPYAFGGYSVKASFSPKAAPRLEVHTEMFAMDYPDMVVNFNKDNIDKGWSARVQRGNGLYFDYQIKPDNESLYLGIGVIRLTEEIALEGTTETNTYNQLEFLLRARYKWFPGEQKNFFIDPYFAMGPRSGMISGSNTINGETYGLLKAIALGSVFVGIQF